MTSSFRSVSTNKTAGATTLVLNAPFGLANGDFMFAFIAWRGVPSSVTDPTGGTTWVRDDIFPTGSISLVVRRYTKIAGPAEPSTYTWSWTPSLPAVAVIAAYSSLDYGIAEGRNSTNSLVFPGPLFPVTEQFASNPQPTTTLTQTAAFSYERRSAILYRGIFFWATYDTVSISSTSPELTQRAFESIGSGPSVYVGDEVIDTGPNPFATLPTRSSTVTPQTAAGWVGRYLVRDNPFSSSVQVPADPEQMSVVGAQEGASDRNLDYQQFTSTDNPAREVPVTLDAAIPSAVPCLPDVSSGYQQDTADAPTDLIFDGLFPGDQPAVNIILEEGW